MKYIKSINDNFSEGNNRKFEEHSDYEIGDILTYREMVNYILDNNLKSVGEDIDYNEARDIASASDSWKLTKVKLSNFDWVSDSDYNNPSEGAFPIVTLDGDEYEVLDGKHRIGMLNDKNYEEYPMWIGEFN